MHEQCDMEPCTACDYMSYEYDSVWGWATTCERCEGMSPAHCPRSMRKGTTMAARFLLDDEENTAIVLRDQQAAFIQHICSVCEEPTFLATEELDSSGRCSRCASCIRVPCDCWCACEGTMPESEGWAGRCHNCAADQHVQPVDHLITLSTTRMSAAAWCRCGWGTGQVLSPRVVAEALVGPLIAEHRVGLPPRVERLA